MTEQLTGSKQPARDSPTDGQFTTADGEPRKPGFHDLRRSRSPVSLAQRHELRRYLGSNEEGQRQALAAADKVFGTGSVSE